MPQALSTNTFTSATWIVNTDTTKGSHTTLAGALSSASSGDTILLQSSVTENPTLKAGVSITALMGSANAPAITITGKCSASFTGSCVISNIVLQTNSDFCLSVTGSNVTSVTLNNCAITASNNTGIQYTCSNASSNIQLNNVTSTPSPTFALYTMSSPGALGFESCNNLGTSTTVSSNSAGVVNSFFTNWNIPVSTSSSGTLNFQQNIMALTNTTCITTAGTGTSVFTIGNLISGTASAISVGAGTTVNLTEALVSSSNTNAITGAGTLNIGDVTFTGSSSTINTSTVVGYTEQHGAINLKTALTVANGGTGAATLTGVLTGNGTSAVTANAVTQYAPVVGGASNAVATIAVGSANQVFQSGGAGVNPVWSTATYPATTTANQILYSNATNTVTGLATANSAVLATNGSGVPSITATPTVTSVTFGSGTALSNYVEGTFTPALALATPGNSAFTYSTQLGKYIQIGNSVTVFINLVLTNFTNTTGSGSVTITGLPFTSASVTGQNYSANITIQNVTFGAAVSYYVGALASNSTTLNISGVRTATTSLALDYLGLSTTSVFRVTLTYSLV